MSNDSDWSDEDFNFGDDSVQESSDAKDAQDAQDDSDLIVSDEVGAVLDGDPEPFSKLPSLDDVFADGVPQADIDFMEQAAPHMKDVVPEEIFSWLRGESEIPKSIAQFGEDVASKFSWFIAYIQLSQLARLPTLVRFTAEAERRHFNPALLSDGLDTTAIGARYKECTTQLMKLLEFTRRFSQQNKEVLKSTATEEERLLLSKIKDLSPEAREKMMELLKKVE